MNTSTVHIIVCIIMAACMAAAIDPPASSTSIKQEVKIEAKVPQAVPAPGAPAAVPLANAEAFKAGAMYYNAMPSAPASAATAVKVIDSKRDIDYVSKVYKLKNKGISAEIASYLRTMVNKAQGEVNVSVNATNEEEFIIVTAPEYQFASVEQMIGQLDNPGTKFYWDGTVLGTYKMKHRLASEISPLVDEILKSRDGAAYVDDKVNMMYYYDSPSYYEGTVEYIRQFDVPPEMVRIEAQILEVEMGDDFNFGLALEQWKEMLPESVDMQLDFQQSRDRADLNMDPGSWAQYAAQSISINGMHPKAMANMINYLVRKGHAKVLSRPTVVAVNGETATIESLETVDYKAYTAENAENQATPLAKKTPLGEVGISLSILPAIGTESLTLRINASVNSLVGWTTSSEPIINRRTTVATAVLKDGELFTLSGLRKDSIVKTDERVPILGSIPLIGYVFRHEVDTKKTAEIIVFLTPHTVTAQKSVQDRERALLDTTHSDVSTPARKGLDTFVDRVLLNKKP